MVFGQKSLGPKKDMLGAAAWMKTKMVKDAQKKSSTTTNQTFLPLTIHDLPLIVTLKSVNLS